MEKKLKEKIKKICKNPMLIIFIIILIFYTPLAIYSPGESRNRGIVTAVGIDKIDNEYEISLLTFIPTVNQSFEEQKSIISAKGPSIAEAVYRAQIAMGRDIGLFHAKTTVVNQSLLKDDVATHLDYLSRVASLPENTVFIGTNKTAKELLRLSQKSKSNIGLKLEQLVGYNAQNIYLTDSSLESFYRGYYDQTKSSIIGYLCVQDESENENASVEKASSSDDMGSSMPGSNSSNNSEQGNKENLVNFKIRTGDKGVDYLEFGTNKGKSIKCGGNTGEEKITEFNDNKDKIILGIFGGYSNCLNSLGVYYITKKDFVSLLYSGLFYLRYVLKKNNEFKNKVLENKGKLNNEDYAILKVCLLPDAPFCSVIRYVLC